MQQEQTGYPIYINFIGGQFFNTCFVLWAFLLQCLSDEKSRSCSTAVGRIVACCFSVGKPMPDTNTGNYCRARKNLSEKALHELVVLAAKDKIKRDTKEKTQIAQTNSK